MKRILCVIRTSTIRQEIESQHNDMIDFLKIKGFSEEEIEWLEAKGASARCVNKSYLDMLETIKSTILSNPSIQACAVWHLNRLGRVESYITQMKEWFINNKIQLYVKNPSLTLLNDDLTYNTGNNIIFAVFAATIPAETEEMMEKFKRGKKAAKEKGKFLGGFIPFGFKNVDSYLVPDDEEMKLVKLVFSEYASGKYSFAKLQKELESRSFKFTKRHIFNLLNCERYIPYVGEETWNKVLEVKKSNNLNLPKESKHVRLCSKLIVCDFCGRHYISDHNQYICYSKKKLSSCKDSKRINIDLLDNIVWDTTSNLYISSLNKMRSTNIAELEKKKVVILQKVGKKEADLDKISTKLENTKSMFMDAEITKQEYEKKKESIHAEKARIDSEIVMLLSELTTINLNIDNYNSEKSLELISQAIEDSQKREIVVKFIKEIRIGVSGKYSHIKIISYLGDVKEFFYSKKLYFKTKDGDLLPYPNYLHNVWKKSLKMVKE